MYGKSGYGSSYGSPYGSPYGPNFGMNPFGGMAPEKMFRIQMLAKRMGVHPLLVLRLLSRRDEVRSDVGWQLMGFVSN
jgi:hypothetical protein